MVEEAKTRHSEAESFPQDRVSSLLPPSPGVTLVQGMEFVARTRRQIERFHFLPNQNGRTLDADRLAQINTLLDEIETGILANPNYKPKAP